MPQQNTGLPPLPAAARPRAPPQEATHACRGLTRRARLHGGAQAPAWEVLRVLRTIDPPQHATAIALDAGGAAKV